jgi:hypothetical protein
MGREEKKAVKAVNPVNGPPHGTRSPSACVLRNDGIAASILDRRVIVPSESVLLKQFEVWRTSADPALRALFWLEDGRAVCASCRRATAQRAGLAAYVSPDTGRLFCWYAVCADCGRELNRTDRLKRLADRVERLIRGTEARN